LLLAERIPDREMCSDRGTALSLVIDSAGQSSSRVVIRAGSGSSLAGVSAVSGRTAMAPEPTERFAACRTYDGF
jgi:hypothetical protein